MSDIIDLGGAPANEECAQLGHTPDFERLNRLEVGAYRAAIIARHGPPPEGCSLTTITNRHDFGIYRTLGLKVAVFPLRMHCVAPYIEAVQDGLASWHEAGFAAPVRYDDGGAPTVERQSVDEIVTGAILATRPDASGKFPIPDFETLHRNLAEAYPQCAEAAQRVMLENADDR